MQAAFKVQVMRVRVWGSGFRVQSSGSRVQGSGFRVQDSGLRVEGAGSRAQNLELGVRRPGLGGRVKAAFNAQVWRFRILSSGLRVRR